MRRSSSRQHSNAPASLTFQAMSRQQAIHRIRRLLQRSAASTQAEQLISLFNIQPEELSEAGVPFEVLKSLERRCFLI
jgi:hypothetical protein